MGIPYFLIFIASRSLETMFLKTSICLWSFLGGLKTDLLAKLEWTPRGNYSYFEHYLLAWPSVVVLIPVVTSCQICTARSSLPSFNIFLFPCLMSLPGISCSLLGLFNVPFWPSHTYVGRRKFPNGLPPLGAPKRGVYCHFHSQRLAGKLLHLVLLLTWKVLLFVIPQDFCPRLAIHLLLIQLATCPARPSSFFI